MKADKTAWLGKVLLYTLDNLSVISKSMVGEENLHMRAVVQAHHTHVCAHARAHTHTKLK